MLFFAAPGFRPSSPCPGCAAQRLTTSSFFSCDLPSRFQVQSVREVQSTARSNQQLGVVRADWNAQVDWKEATITDAKKAGENPLLTSLWVDVREVSVPCPQNLPFQDFRTSRETVVRGLAANQQKFLYCCSRYVQEVSKTEVCWPNELKLLSGRWNRLTASQQGTPFLANTSR